MVGTITKNTSRQSNDYRCQLRTALVTMLSLTFFPSVADSDETTKPATHQEFSLVLAGNAVTHINPLEPLYLLFNVQAKRDARLEDIRTQIVKDIAIDGIPFFDRSVPPRIMSVDVLRYDESIIGFVLLFWNGKFAFDLPGIHRVRLHPDLEVTIIVDEPEPRDADVLTRLMQIKESYRLLIMNPMARQDGKDLETIARVIDEHPNGAYAPWLALGLGQVRLLTLARTAIQADEVYYRDRERIASKYLEPYCMGEIRSPIHAAGALQLAMEIEAAEKLNLRKGEPIDELKLAIARRASQAVEQSRPFSLAHLEQARMFLGEIESVEQQSRKNQEQINSIKDAEKRP